MAGHVRSTQEQRTIVFSLPAVATKMMDLLARPIP
jgi:hypothetical protein